MLCDCPDAATNPTPVFSCYQWPPPKRNAAPPDTTQKLTFRLDDCPAQLDGGTCHIPVDATDYYCIAPNGNDACQCWSGSWKCPSASCPAVLHAGDACTTFSNTCISDLGELCICLPENGTGPCGHVMFPFADGVVDIDEKDFDDMTFMQQNMSCALVHCPTLHHSRPIDA
jgi:hypothetical protein